MFEIYEDLTSSLTTFEIIFPTVVAIVSSLVEAASLSSTIHQNNPGYRNHPDNNRIVLQHTISFMM